MICVRPALAHLLVVAIVPLVGCSASHGRDGDDAGSIVRDAGPLPTHDGSVIAVDAGRALDAGVIEVRCDPQDARPIVCAESVCDALPSWYWTGDRCIAVECGACEGEDCGEGLPSEEACEAAHASCEATSCRETGGTWMWWAEECEHYACGRPSPATCLVGRPVCDCGPDRAFVPEEGCVAADCAAPPPRSREEACTSSGGSWEAICCDTECGEFCELACASMACNCGPGRVFDDARGCVDGARCHERRRGESCNADARCEGGTICCDRCGGAGCSGRPTCVDPVCDSDPDTDTCGNDRLAP